METIIAFGILVTAFGLFFSLYSAAIDYSGRTGRKIVAATVAQRQLAKLRGWAVEPGGSGLGFYDWTAYTDSSFPDEEFPDYQVRVQSADAPISSPSSQLIAGGVPKTFTTTLRKVQITISWGDGESLRVASLIADPTRQLRAVDPVVISPSGGVVVARNGTVDFSVEVFDQDGRPIPDVMAKWYVKAITGAGKVTGVVGGSSATFQNVSERRDGTPQYTGGQCRVTARVVYRGQEAWGESEILVLEP